MCEQFKILAIQPLKHCESHILKNLKKKEIYYFYKDYSFADDEVELNEEFQLSPDFFSVFSENESDNSTVQDSPKISIHALVGKNGSGKSALVELLMRTINNIGSCCLDNKEVGVTIFPVYGLHVNLYYLANGNIYKLQVNSELEKKVSFDVYKSLLPSKNECGKKVSFVEDKENNVLLNDFFYSIVINYSMYAYNVKDFLSEWIDEKESDYAECWINGLMHKNDGYQTPLVINPMRTEGSIDVKIENHLTLSRLLSLYVKTGKDDDDDKKNARLLKFNEKNEISTLKFIKINYDNEKDNRDNKLHNYLSKNFSKNGSKYVLTETLLFITCTILDIWREKEKLDIEDISSSEEYFEIIDETVEYNYLVYKTISIIEKYYSLLGIAKNETYKEFYLNNLPKEDMKKIISKHIEKIHDDTSHITFKIRQTLNYIKHSDDYGLLETNEDGVEVADFGALIKRLSDGKSDLDLINFIPPPFFKTEIFCKNTKKSEESKESKESDEYSFNTLSSGEKQLVFFTSSILYHIRNLDSAFSGKEKRIKYKNVQIILEEIELYFHPELQRTMIRDLISSLKNMHFESIENIDICMVTHSPIILSDIPVQNILFLEDGMPIPKTENTFAANIHTLYRDAFFFDGMPIGEFAKNKINELVKKIEGMDKSNYSEIKKEINIIGEPLLKKHLLNKFYEKTNVVERLETLENEIEKLKGMQDDKN